MFEYDIIFRRRSKQLAFETVNVFRESLKHSKFFCTTIRKSIKDEVETVISVRGQNDQFRFVTIRNNICLFAVHRVT